MTFKDITKSVVDLKSIAPCNADGSPLAMCMNQVTLQKMDGGGTYLPGEFYGFISINNMGWCKSMVPISDGAVTFKSGEAVCLNNTLGSDAYMKVSGEVDLQPQTAPIPVGFSLVGNLTPVPVDIREIIPLNVDGTPIAMCMNQITMQKMDAGGTYLTGEFYGYISINNMGWCKNMVPVGEKAVMLQPGESVCVNNTLGTPIVLKFPNPVK